MMPVTRGDIEVLLDSPDETNYVVSAFADLTVKDGFRDLFDRDLRDQARAANAMLAEADARKALDENLEQVRSAFRDEIPPQARGAAVFVSAARGLRHVMPLEFPVENRLVIDEDPFVLPLLERWHGEPNYLVAVFDADHAHIFEARHGTVSPAGEVQREDVHQDLQRDKPRFTYKKRFAQSFHERLHGAQDDNYLRVVAAELGRHWAEGDFQGLILMGRPSILGGLRQLLGKDLAAAVAEEVEHVTSAHPDDVEPEVSRVVERWHAGQDAAITAELQQRWKENYRVADGPTAVLDALQQGRAARVICGRDRGLAGARCRDCGYRFGAPSATCHYCGGACRSINAVQETLRLALKHRVPVHLFRRGPDADPLASHGGMAALLLAEANWAPDKATARATQGA